MTDVRKMLGIFCCIAACCVISFSSIAHDAPLIAAQDKARNHLIDEVSPAVYTLRANFRFHKRDTPETLQERGSWGTAFGVTENGLLLTVFHAVGAPVFQLDTQRFLPTYVPPFTWTYTDGQDAEATYTVTAKDGTQHIAEIVAIDPENDLAILSIAKTSPNKFPFIEFERENLNHDSVVAIGSPFGFALSVTEGIISRNQTGDGFVQTNVMVHPGNSGGPLLLLRNHKVAGVLTKNFNPLNSSIGIGIAFAVPASVAAKLLDDTLRELRRLRIVP